MNLGGLDLNLLVAFDALLSERSVTRAAQRVGLSQPGMSNALARLRRLLDDPLLVRQGALLVPTARAEALMGPVHEALELIRGALDAPLRFDPSTDRRSFRLSCSDYSVLMLIGRLVRALAAEAEAFLRRIGDIRVLESPIELPGLVETLWWHSRSTVDPAHAWLRTRISEVASTLID
jgi:DNA-binding transcriptional LysR family regulator